MIRTVAAALLALHGLIHLIGLFVPWRIATLEGFPYTTSALWGRLELGDAGARLVGVIWLLAALAFVVSAYGIWQQTAWTASVLVVTALVSLVLCLLGSPAAFAGVVIDLVILAVVGYLRIVAPSR